MSIQIQPGLSFIRGTFSIYIAPSATLSEALNNYLSCYKGSILYLSGNVPVILSGVGPSKRQWRMKRVTRGEQILATLERSSELLIIIEHERSLYDDDADLIRPVAQICRQKVVEGRTIFMFATRTDGWLNKFEPFAHQLICGEELVYHRQRTKNETCIRSGQMTLEGMV